MPAAISPKKPSHQTGRPTSPDQQVTGTAEHEKMRGMSYAPFLAAAFLLWPLTSMAGTQGNVLLLALAAIPALFVARPGIRPAHYLLAGMAFLVWAVASESWSPVSRGIISGTLMGGDFAIRSAGLRIILTLFFTTLLIAGALRTAPGRAQISSRLILGSLSIHGLLILLSPVFATSVMPVFYGDDPLNHSSGFQNLDRGANAFALVLPILVAYVGARPGLAWKGLALMIALASLVLGMGLPVTAAYIVLGTLSAPALYGLITDSQMVQALVDGNIPEAAMAVLMLAAPESAASLGTGMSVEAAEALMASGAVSVDAYITHGVLSGGAVARVTSSPLQSLVTTDSIATTEAVRVARNIRQISVAPLLGESIRRIAEERSVSSLFNF